MPPLDGIRRLLRLPTRSARAIASDVDDELRFHLDMRAAELAARHGWDAERARAEALRQFGDVDEARAWLAAEDGRAELARRRRFVLAELGGDVRHAWRALRRAPAFAVVGAVTLALGVGANATMFSLVDRLLLRPPAGVAEPDRVVRVYGRGYWTALTRSYPDYEDLRDGVRTLAGVAAYQSWEATVKRPVRESIVLQRATASFLPVLGVRPALGRGLAEGDQRGAGERVAVISDALWRRQFGGVATVLDSSLVIGREAYRVVGVLPPAFRGVHLERADAWVPLGELRRDRGNFGAVHVVARLAPGATLAAADRDANRANRAGIVAAGLPADEDVMQLGPVSITQGPAAPKEVRVARWLAMVAGLVLLIAAANLAHLFVARALARAGESAVRAALGAGRGRLVRQWVVEGAALGALGGALALGVVMAADRALGLLALPGAAADGVEPRTAALVLLLAVGAGVAAACAAAWQGARLDPAAGLRLGARSGGAPRGLRLRGALLLVQVALTAVLLVSAGLLSRSLARVDGIPLGVDESRLVVVRAGGDANLSEGATDSLMRRVADRARALPEVERASLAHTLPFTSSWRTRWYVPGGDPERWGKEGGGRWNHLSMFVAPEYRATAGLALLAGRWIEPGDDAGAARVAVVSDTLARLAWPGAAPAAVVGRCMLVLEPGAPCTRVVGVVRAARVEDVFEEAPPQYYLPLAQPARGEGATALLVRTAGDPALAAAALRRALQPLAPADVEIVAAPLEDAIAPVRRPWTLGASVFATFGVLALLVAAAGLYGVVTLLVVERMHELGVRRALGARASDLVRAVGVRVWRVTALGLVVGLALGWAGARAGRSLLYGVGPLDPLSYLAAGVLLGVVALAASARPLRRAARVDPMTAMRAE